LAAWPGLARLKRQGAVSFLAATQPTVDELGNFTAHAGAAFEGRNVLGDGNTAVIDHIRAAGLLLAERKYTHRYLPTRIQ
jgi:isoleucyl-tRNA synthetase